MIFFVFLGFVFFFVGDILLFFCECLWLLWFNWVRVFVDKVWLDLLFFLFLFEADIGCCDDWDLCFLCWFLLWEDFLCWWWFEGCEFLWCVIVWGFWWGWNVGDFYFVMEELENWFWNGSLMCLRYVLYILVVVIVLSFLAIVIRDFLFGFGVMLIG